MEQQQKMGMAPAASGQTGKQPRTAEPAGSLQPFPNLPPPQLVQTRCSAGKGIVLEKAYCRDQVLFNISVLLLGAFIPSGF